MSKAGKSDFEQLGILFRVLPLLTDIAALHQQSALVSPELDGAVADLVMPRGSLLHYVVMVLLSAISMEHDLEDRKQRRLANMELIRVLLVKRGANLLNLTDGNGRTAAHILLRRIIPSRSFCAQDDRQTCLKLALEMLNLFDMYGQHWDSYNGDDQQSLMETVAANPALSSFYTELLCRPRSLQWLSASVVVKSAWTRTNTWKRLPPRIKVFILEHAPRELPVSCTVATRAQHVEASTCTASECNRTLGLGAIARRRMSFVCSIL